MKFNPFRLVRAPIERRFVAWLERRMPACEVLVLDQRTIFIFPSMAGWFFFVVGALILIGAANYQNNMGLALAFWLGSLALVGLFLSFRNVLGVRLRAAAPAPVFCGELMQFPIWLDDPQGRQHLLLGLGNDAASLQEIDVPAQQSVMQQLLVPTQKRGWLAMPRFLLQSHAPFGWMRVWSWPLLAERGLVYPAPVMPASDWLQAEDAAGKSRRQMAGMDDFTGHRRFRSGDSIRSIDWKAYARERGVLVQEFSTPASDERWFRLAALPKAPLELQLSWLTALLLDAERRGQRYGLDTGRGRLTPDQGDLHLHRCLKLLALHGLKEAAT